MSKQTALQWFLQELETKNGEYRGFNNLRITHGSLIEQALQIEREQIDNFIDFINERHFNQFIISKDEAEIYYEQTYGGQDE
jgi:hypothetical protein